jgi:hypothetical protein
LLGLADFGPGLAHVAEAYQNGKVFAIVHQSDPARIILPGLVFAPGDPWLYVFVHGGEEATRFENLRYGTHEIPVAVVAQLLLSHYGAALAGADVRLCTCFGNMLRPGDAETLAQRLARALPQATFEAYHALIILERGPPPRMRFGYSVQWGAFGAVIVGPPGGWEPVIP